MIGRRGFLGTLLAGGAAAALDPERLLWRPGKLISIPPRVHIPRWHHFFVDCRIPATTGVLGALSPYIKASVGDRSPETYGRVCNLVAESGLRERIDAEITKAGGRKAEFQKLVVPAGLDFAYVGPVGQLPNARILQCYDIYRDEWHRRMECRVRI